MQPMQRTSFCPLGLLCKYKGKPMTNKLKCPVCQNVLRKLFNRYTGEPNCDYECGNFDCDLYGIEIPESVWKAVIKKLEDLKIATKALDRAKLILKNLLPDLDGYERLDVEKALAEIATIEHKE